MLRGIASSLCFSRPFALFDNVVRRLRAGVLDFSREMARRTVWIRLDAKTADPHLRTGFHHDPLRAWVRQHRRELVRAVLIFVQHWLALGRPRFTGRRLGPVHAFAPEHHFADAVLGRTTTSSAVSPRGSPISSVIGRIIGSFTSLGHFIGPQQ